MNFRERNLIDLLVFYIFSILKRKQTESSDREEKGRVILYVKVIFKRKFKPSMVFKIINPSKLVNT